MRPRSQLLSGFLDVCRSREQLLVAVGAPTNPVFTCPMHPEVREPKPGNCPKCGMTLELVSPASAAAGKAEWTCPMHLEVARDAPGSCPKCGMTPERRTQSGANEESDGELGTMKSRLWLAIALTVPLLAIAMGANIAPVRLSTAAEHGRPSGR
jgi:Cu+-exporting ATPase